MKGKLFSLLALVVLGHSSFAHAACIKYVTWDSACIDVTAQNSSTDPNNPSAKNFVYYNSALFLRQNGVDRAIPGNMFAYYNTTTNLLTNVVAYINGALYANPFLSNFYVHDWSSTSGYFVIGVANEQNSAIADFHMESFSLSGGHLLHNGNPVPNDTFFTFNPITLMATYVVTANGTSISARMVWDHAGYITAAPTPSGGSVDFGYTFSNCTRTDWGWSCR